MTNLIKAITFGTLVIPISTVMFQVAVWVYLSSKGIDADLSERIHYGILKGLFGMIFGSIILLIYGVLVYFILNKIKQANWPAVILFALLPWAIYYFPYEGVFYYFVEFAWYSIASASIFWFFATQRPVASADA